MSGNVPTASSPAARKRMQATKQRDTSAEMKVRRAVHALGLRYRVDQKVLPNGRRRADMVFRKAKVAVFIDGCFWHSCPEHGTKPSANADWWHDKLAANRARDRTTDAELGCAGWQVLRVWEHEDPAVAARRIEVAVRAALDQPSYRLIGKQTRSSQGDGVVKQRPDSFAGVVAGSHPGPPVQGEELRETAQ